VDSDHAAMFGNSPAFLILPFVELDESEPEWKALWMGDEVTRELDDAVPEGESIIHVRFVWTALTPSPWSHVLCYVFLVVNALLATRAACVLFIFGRVFSVFSVSTFGPGLVFADADVSLGEERKIFSKSTYPPVDCFEVSACGD